MKKEYVTINLKETSIKLQASTINSLRVKDIKRNAVRVYQDGLIGISGAVGEISEDILTKQAIDNLSSGISYPYPLETNNKDHRDYSETKYSEQNLMKVTEELIAAFKQDYDDFIFSESIKSIAIDYQLNNTEGLDLRYQDEYLELGLIVKAKTSPNLFDTFLGWNGRNFDKENFVSFAKKQLQAERTTVSLPKEEKIPVFFLNPDSLTGFLQKQLNGETYGNNASLFDQKLGEQLFHEKLTITQNNNPKESYSMFFDVEGVTKEHDKVPLIEHGVLKHVFTDKKNAKKFALPHTGSASGAYDDIPSLGAINIVPEVDSEDIKKTLNGQKAILVFVAAGGEFNADGHYASPVQASYLFNGQTLQGKLPEFTMTNDVYSMLGNDYIGTFNTEHIYVGDQSKLFGCYMHIKQS